MPQSNMPKDWEPPYPSWSAAFTPAVNTVVIGYFAAQHTDGDVAGFKHWMQSVLPLDDGPRHCEQASYVDATGCLNHIYICYWTDRDCYERWAAAPQVEHWWNDPARLSGATGYWREVIFAPMARLETLFSSEDAAGMGTLAPGFTGPVKEHGYWGACGTVYRPPQGMNFAVARESNWLTCRPCRPRPGACA